MEEEEFRFHSFRKMERRILIQDRKGMSLGDLYPVILTIALVAILLAVVLFVMQEWTITTATDVGTVTNETDAWLNATPYTVDDVGECGFNTFAVTGIWNQNNGTAIPAASYTVGAAGTLVNATTATWNSVNLSYTYKSGGADCDAMEDITGDFVDFIPWIGVILLIVAAAIVLGIVIRSFAGGGRSRV